MNSSLSVLLRRPLLGSSEQVGFEGSHPIALLVKKGFSGAAPPAHEGADGVIEGGGEGSYGAPVLEGEHVYDYEDAHAGVPLASHAVRHLEQKTVRTSWQRCKLPPKEQKMCALLLVCVSLWCCCGWGNPVRPLRPRSSEC